MPKRKRSDQGAGPPQKRDSAHAPASRPFRLQAWMVPLIYALATLVLFREALLGGALLLGTDTQALSYFARNFYTEFVRQFHTFPLWNPLLFGGLPFIDGMHGDIFYPPSLALFFMDAAHMWAWKMALHVFLAGVFCFAWLRELGLRRELALFGGLVFMVGGDLVSLVFPGGDGKLFVSALAPLAFWLTERAISRRHISDYALFSLGIALMVFTSHMQAAYFAIWGVTLYFFFRLLQLWRTERQPVRIGVNLGLFAVAGVLGVGAAAVQFFPPLGYLRTYSHRAEKTNAAESGEAAYQYSTTYSLHAEEVGALVVPEFVGDWAQTETLPGKRYWGRNGFKLNNEFAGFIPLMLAPLLFLRRRSGRTWFFAGLAVVTILYALGANTPAFRLFYLIPGVKLFRAPSIIIFLYGLSVATLGAFALERALAWAAGTPAERGTARRYLWIATGLFAVLAILAATGILVSMWTGVREVANPQALTTNLPYITRGFLLTFVFALLVTLVWEGMARGIYGSGMVVTLLCMLAFFEGYRVDRPFIQTTVLQNDDRDPLFMGDEGTNFLRQRMAAGEVFRAWDFGGANANLLAVHGIEQIGGHHGNEIGRYRTLIGGEGLENLQTSDLRLLDVTNTQYIASNQLLNIPSLKEVYRGTSKVVYQNVNALPRAYLAGRAEVVSDATAVQRLLGPGFDYRSTAILPAALPMGTQIQPDPQGTVEWVERGTNAYRLKVRTDKPALLMVLDNYYPQWKATVDGQPVDVLRANYTFRAVPVGAGEHEIAFRYDPSNVRAPALLSAALLILLALIGFGLPAWQRRGRPAPAEA